MSRLQNDPFGGDVTDDAFLGGRLQILQPRVGYRAGVDPVLLAASVTAQPGQRVLDLGCGVGVAGLCLAARVRGVLVTGLELQSDYAALAQQNAVKNSLPFEVVTGDLMDMPGDLRQQQFDHVIANPPYYDRAASTGARDAGREIAMGEALTLRDWAKAASRRTVSRGTVTFVHKADRLGDMIAAFSSVGLGSLQILPIIPRKNRTAQLVLVRCIKGGRAALKLHDALRMHKGTQHKKDGADYRAEVENILRHGAGLRWSS